MYNRDIGGHSEEWRAVPDFEGLYEVSSLGRIRSLYFDPPRLCAFSADKSGYPIVQMNKNGRRICKVVHRLVCRAFHGEPTALHKEAAHLDGNRTNPAASNLKWCSKAENHSHKRAHGSHGAGEKHPRALLTEADVYRIIARIAVGERDSTIAADFGVKPRTINGIARGKAWRHLQRPKPAPRYGYPPRTHPH